MTLATSQPFQAAGAGFFEYLRSQKQVENIWELPAAKWAGKSRRPRAPAPASWAASARARARARQERSTFLFDPRLFFGEGGERRGEGEAGEMRCRGNVFLPSCLSG